MRMFKDELVQGPGRNPVSLLRRLRSGKEVDNDDIQIHIVPGDVAVFVTSPFVN